MQPYSKLLDAAAPRTITSSTDATPIVVTTAAHGFSTGDRITINGHATNTNANGDWFITVVTATTFSLDGSTATGGGAGGATGCFCVTVGAMNVEDYKDIAISWDTDGGGDAAMTVKLVGSIQDDAPDFAAPQAANNQYEFIYQSDYENPAAENIDGDTGFVVASADNHRLLKANIVGLKWLGVIPTAGTEGELTVGVRRFNVES